MQRFNLSVKGCTATPTGCPTWDDMTNTHNTDTKFLQQKTSEILDIGSNNLRTVLGKVIGSNLKRNYLRGSTRNNRKVEGTERTNRSTTDPMKMDICRTVKAKILPNTRVKTCSKVSFKITDE